MVINSNDRFEKKRVQPAMTRRIREVAHYITRGQMNIEGLQRPYYKKSKPCKILVKVYPPTKSKIDPPNLYPTVKALVDGMTDAGLWSDDNYEIVKQMAFQYGGTSGRAKHYKLEIIVDDWE